MTEIVKQNRYLPNKHYICIHSAIFGSLPQIGNIPKEKTVKKNNLNNLHLLDYFLVYVYRAIYSKKTGI